MDRRADKVAIRARIIGMRDSGQNIQQIAANIEMSAKTLRKWIQR